MLDMSPDSLILDCGCGTGLIESNIDFPSNSNIIGLDLSVEMLAIARDSVKRLNVHWMLADADHLPFRRHCFQLVVCVTVVQNIPSPERTVLSIKDILVPKGTLVLTGLRKSFRRQDLLELVKNAGFQLTAVDENPQLKDVILVCRPNRELLNSPTSS